MNETGKRLFVAPVLSCVLAVGLSVTLRAETGQCGDDLYGIGVEHGMWGAGGPYADKHIWADVYLNETSISTTNFEIDWDDGSSWGSADQPPTQYFSYASFDHIYAANGTYHITAYVDNDEVSCHLTFTMTVGPQ